MEAGEEWGGWRLGRGRWRLGRGGVLPTIIINNTGVSTGH